MSSETQPTSEREQTDESLKFEREKADEAIAEKLAAIEETADAVISRARERADAVLAAARAHSDQKRAAEAPFTPTPHAIHAERGVEDRVLRQERASADATLRTERAESVQLLSIERQETDRDLSSERSQADAVLSARDQFLGLVGHELRNMLAAIMASAELIQIDLRKLPGAERPTAHAGRIRRAGLRMKRLIGDLVDVATIDAGVLAVTLERANPAQVLEEAVESLQAQAAAGGITLRAEVAPGVPVAEFDPARILQVLTNLLSNAIKFTPPGGAVLARVAVVDGALRFSARDSGQGIPSDKLEEIFQRFLQVDGADRRGVGLGLYISRCIVESHGGRIWAESRAGEGATIHFTLPSAPRGD